MTALNDLEGARILVTGGAGLIGRATVAALRLRGAEVAVFDLPSGDVTDPASVALAVQGQDAVVHLGGYAGLGMADSVETYRVNAVGTFGVFVAAAEAGVAKIVYASSINANGYPLNPAAPLPSVFPYDETLTPDIGDEYSLSKQASEDAAAMVARRWNVSLTGLRFPLTRDITEDSGRVFGRHIRAALTADPRRQAAEGWSYLDVSDAALSVVASLTHETPASPGILVAAPLTYLSTPTAEALARFAPGAGGVAGGARGAGAGDGAREGSVAGADGRGGGIPGRAVGLDLTLSRTLLGFEARVLLDDVAPAQLVDLDELDRSELA